MLFEAGLSGSEGLDLTCEVVLTQDDFAGVASPYIARLPVRSADRTAGECFRPGRQHQRRPARHRLPHDPRLLPTACRPERVSRHGWLHSLSLDSAADRIIHNVLQLQLARRLARNFQSTNPAPYPHPDPLENLHDPDPPSVEKLRGIQSEITFFLRPSHLCSAPLCYAAASPANQTS